jgi:hypothetical protein
VFKGSAIFPLLDKALIWLQEAMEMPNADKTKIVERSKVIEGEKRKLFFILLDCLGM